MIQTCCHAHGGGEVLGSDGGVTAALNRAIGLQPLADDHSVWVVTDNDAT